MTCKILPFRKMLRKKLMFNFLKMIPGSKKAGTILFLNIFLKGKILHVIELAPALF